MKKSILLIAGLVGLSLASCKEDNSLGTMQKNEAPIIVPTEGVAIQSLWKASGNTINLQNYVNNGEIALIDAQVSTSFPEGANVNGIVQIAKDASFTNPQTISLSSVKVDNTSDELKAAVEGESVAYQGYVTVDDWNQAFQALYGKNPAAEINYVRMGLRLQDGNQSLILYNNGEEWWGPMDFMVTPLDAGYDIAESYTLYYTLGDKEYSTVMNHSSSHIYDDPVFTASINPGAGQNLTWWVAPTDNADRTYGVEEASLSAKTGNLVEMSEGGVAGQFTTTDEKIEFSVNMLDLTFSYQFMANFEYLYTPGASNGWSQTNSQLLYTSNHETYVGYAYLKDAFKFTTQADWDGTNYGAGAEEGTISATGGDISVEEGLYWVEVNITNLTYKLTPIKTISLIGSFNDWSGDVQLTASEDMLTWTGTLALEADAKWKFRMNNDWAHNLGGTLDDLVPDGADLSSNAGTYTVTLDLSKLPYSCTVVAK